MSAGSQNPAVSTNRRSAPQNKKRILEFPTPSGPQIGESLRKQAQAIAGAIQSAKVSTSDKAVRALLNAIPTLIWISDDNHGRTCSNLRWLQFTGRAAEQELGRAWAASIHPADLAKVLEGPARAANRAHCFTLEYRLRRADGEYVRITEVVAPIVCSGKICGYIGCADLSDRRDPEQARRQISERLIQAQEAERTRIARELHDDIGQRLAILRIEMLRAGKPVSSSSKSTHPKLKDLSTKVKEIADQVAILSHQLHSPELEFLGIKVAIESACREFSERRHIPIDCYCEGIPAHLDDIVGLSLLRVLQEALHNIDKYSDATRVDVRLVRSGENLTLEIVDNGRGFDVEQARFSGGLGLVSMRERIHLTKGEFEITSAPGEGTRIFARVPVPLARSAKTVASASSS